MSLHFGWKNASTSCLTAFAFERGKEGEMANMKGQVGKGEAHIEDGQVEEEAHAMQANCQNVF